MKSTPSHRGVIPTTRPNSIGMGSRRLGVVTTIGLRPSPSAPLVVCFQPFVEISLQREPTAVEVGYLNSTFLLGFSKCCLRDAGYMILK